MDDRHPRRILLAVTGLSPQIVTETLYALATAPDGAWIPSEVHLITTTEGARRASLALLSEDPAWFHHLCRDYALPAIAFDETHIHVVKNEDGQPLEDIRTPADNERVADYICQFVRSLTDDPRSALHVSIAGGRKTMGYYLGYALSLFGRPQDRLSHVLVSEPFESSWGFFYPTPYSRVIETRDGSLADTHQAQVTLAHIPFVSLRDGLDSRLTAGAVSFSEVVAAARLALQPAELYIDLHGQRIRASGREVRLQPVQLALLSVFARRARHGEPPLAAPAKHVLDQEWAERFLAEYTRILSGEMDNIERTRVALRKGMDQDYFFQTRTRLHETLTKCLGPDIARKYSIHGGSGRPRRYRLALEPDQIHYRSWGDAPQACES